MPGTMDLPADAPLLRAPVRRYDGQVTKSERWALYTPRRGDIIVSTPAKCGTTWTQSIVAMLLNGGPDLPMPVPVMSPWVDADVGNSEASIRDALVAQNGRRVVKTHTPLDGVSEWDGVHVITVYRHPLDVFFSLRKHYFNMTIAAADDVMLGAEAAALDAFLDDPVQCEAYSSKTLDAVVLHYLKTLDCPYRDTPTRLHYADMRADHRGAVARLACLAEIEASPALIDAVTEATGFGAMKARSDLYAPGADSGLFHSNAAFFDSGRSQKWVDKVSAEQLARFDARMAALVPDATARAWLLGGDAAVSQL